MTYSIKQKIKEDNDLQDKFDYFLHLIFLAHNDTIAAKAEFESLDSTAKRQVLNYVADNDYAAYNYFNQFN